jgi:hypothetical protein
VGPRDSLNDVEKRKFLTLLGLRPLGRSARSQPLYRLLVRTNRGKLGMEKYYIASFRLKVYEYVV